MRRLPVLFAIAMIALLSLAGCTTVYLEQPTPPGNALPPPAATTP